MPLTELDVIAAFSTKLALRPDSDRVFTLLARSFYDHRADLWPFSTVGVHARMDRGPRL